VKSNEEIFGERTAKARQNVLGKFKYVPVNNPDTTLADAGSKVTLDLGNESFSRQSGMSSESHRSNIADAVAASDTARFDKLTQILKDSGDMNVEE
jgi:hypothetical protein